MKRKELFWMLLPCLLVVPLWIARQKRNPPFTLHAVYTGIQNLPVTATDVAEGFDTKIALNLRAVGEASPPYGTQYQFAIVNTEHCNVRLVYGSPPKELPYRFWQQYSPAPTLDRDKIQMQVMMKLGKIPAHYGEIHLRTQTGVELNYTEPPRTMPPFIHIRSPLIDIDVPVRTPNDHLRAPQVSHQSAIHLSRVLLDQQPFSSFGDTYTPSGNDIRLEVNFRPNHVADLDDPDQHFTYLICLSAKLVDDAGNVYKTYSTEELIAAGVFEKNKDAKISFLVPLSAAPLNAGKLTFQGRFCADQRWPLVLSVVVREGGKPVSDAVGKKQPIVLRPNNPRIKIEPQKFESKKP